MKGSADFDYEVIRRPRRMRPAISVSPDLTVRVLLPAWAPESVAHELVRDKADWVQRKLAGFRARHRPERQWVDGETLPWLGQEFPLRILPGAEDTARLEDGVWEVLLDTAPASFGGSSEETRQRRVVQALRHAVMAMAQDWLVRRTAHVAERIRLRPASVGIKNYRSRWGSCHADGRIWFNWRIAMAPAWVADYVVIHELCHLRHRNHSPAFRALVAQWMPEWKAARAWLREHGHTLDVLDDVDGGDRRRP